MKLDSIEISLEHQELLNYTISTNDFTIKNSSTIIDLSKPQHIKIHFEPFKIKPILRFDNIFINYWLSDIVYWDHMLEFDIDSDFWIKYYKKETESQLKFVKENYANDPFAADKYVGIYDVSDIIAQIRKNING